MGEGQTEREALLEARVKELEAAAALRENRPSTGGIFEQAWRFLSIFVPPWIIAAGLAMFLIFHGWEYYNQAQIAVAETQLAKAQAALKDAESRSQTAMSEGGNTVRMETVKAELEKAQQEAARAKIEADAQNSMVQDATMRLATLQAELANKQAEATKARAAADAASKKFGLQTLEQRAANAKLVTTELEAALSRADVVAPAAVASGGSIVQMQLKTARALCANNRYAQYINCPPQFITNPPPMPQALIQDQSAPWPSVGGTLRKPTMFDCARASMGVDYVICASASLLDAEARLEDAYKAARLARGDEVKAEQIAWNKRYGPECGLPLRGPPPPEQISQARGCIEAAINKRIRELQTR